MESGIVRKGLNTRVAEALDADPRVLEWHADTTQDRLRYIVTFSDGMPMVFSPGEVADWFGV